MSYRMRVIFFGDKVLRGIGVFNDNFPKGKISLMTYNKIGIRKEHHQMINLPENTLWFDREEVDVNGDVRGKTRIIFMDRFGNSDLILAKQIAPNECFFKEKFDNQTLQLETRERENIGLRESNTYKTPDELNKALINGLEVSKKAKNLLFSYYEQLKGQEQ